MPQGTAVIWAKLHREGRDVLLAACDGELLGKEFGGSVLSKRFYGGEPVDEKRLGELLDGCTAANLAGERVIKAAKSKGLVRDGGVMLVSGVPHAQIVRML